MNPEHRRKLESLHSFTIAHPMYSDALAVLRRAAEAKKIGRRDCGAALFGNSGTGKTHLAEDFMREFPSPHRDSQPNGNSSIKPVIYCRVPSEATVKALINRILQTMGVYMARRSQEHLEFQLFQNLKSCKTQLLVLDEYPHLLRSLTPNSIRVAGDWIKNLSDLFSGLVLLAGETDSERLIDERAAMGDRFPYRAYLHPFSLTTEENADIFQRLLCAFSVEIQRTFKFTDMPLLNSEREILAFYALTYGNLRQISELIYGACEVALRRDDGTLLLSDFSTTSCETHFRNRLSASDIFSLNITELRKLVYTKKGGKYL